MHSDLVLETIFFKRWFTQSVVDLTSFLEVDNKNSAFHHPANPKTYVIAPHLFLTTTLPLMPHPWKAHQYWKLLDSIISFFLNFCISYFPKCIGLVITNCTFNHGLESQITKKILKFSLIFGSLAIFFLFCSTKLEAPLSEVMGDEDSMGSSMGIKKSLVGN